MRRALAVSAALAALLSGCSRPGDRPLPSTQVPELVIVTVTPAPARTPGLAVAVPYTVVNGDTLSGIAARFGVAEDAIISANGLANRDELYVGQQILIPSP